MIMAAGWTVVLETPIAGGLPASAAGKSLLYYQRQIDDLATSLDLAPLSSFFSRDPQAIAKYMRELGVEPDMDALPDEEWHHPVEGLITVCGLLECLRSDPKRVPEPEKIIADLEGVEHALNEAATQGIRFHLGRELSMPEPR